VTQLPCGWRPDRGTWHEAVKRAERNRRRKLAGRILFSIIALASVLALYAYGMREIYRHWPGHTPKPKSSNGAVRSVDVILVARDVDDYQHGQLSTRERDGLFFLAQTGGSNRGTRNWLTNRHDDWKTGGDRAVVSAPRGHRFEAASW